MLIKNISAIALVGALSGLGFAGEQPPAWITVDDEAYQLVKEGMPSLFTGYETEQGLIDRLANISQGKVHIVAIHPKKVTALSLYLHMKQKRCGGFIQHETAEAAISGVANAFNPPASIAAINYQISEDDMVRKLIGQTKESSIRETIQQLSRYHDRYYKSKTGVEAANWIKDYWQKLAGDKTGVSVKTVDHNDWQQPSVVMTWQGSETPDEIVVIGGHLDSINGRNISLKAPGADDNASGIATITEVIRVLVESNFKPKKTIKFMGYAAEEVGLRGSSEIARQHKNQGAKVVGVLQLDMTNYNGSQDDFNLVSDYTNDRQNKFIAELSKKYLPQLKVGYTRCGYGCSDHASWHNNGFPASMPFEAKFNQSNRSIHTERDTLDQMGGNANHALKFSKLATAFVVEMAKHAGNGNPQPPKPDPNPNPDDGKYKQLSTGKGTCLGILSDSGKTGIRASSGDCTGATSQLWSIDSKGLVHPKHAPNKCLIMRNWKKGVNTAELGECKAEQLNQRWQLDGGRINNLAYPNFYLTHFGRYYGDWTGVWKKYKSDYQKWSWKK
ncbi:M20/M25/M40 family metallo-hydrolase [Spartinivicinus poritis]|uniref:M20/M25/M40 family metallo-hydrolase n=1 Tax=Spartinivicinus poritis TaxID=2994640 RepID=A0ABT5U4Z6_9GAMM|nr:M20/M25/M40 family metallo-hydrolase [Spartinivicinus sp. A2-2]MDE1460617.1 M20/M25/M40 family metallo-hydrolase [Spartinivicinus sp. A2-2]